MGMIYPMDHELYFDQNSVTKEESDIVLMLCSFYYHCHEAEEIKVKSQVTAIILFLYHYDLVEKSKGQSQRSA